MAFDITSFALDTIPQTTLFSTIVETVEEVAADYVAAKKLLETRGSDGAAFIGDSGRGPVYGEKYHAQTKTWESMLIPGHEPDPRFVAALG